MAYPPLLLPSPCAHIVRRTLQARHRLLTARRRRGSGGTVSQVTAGPELRRVARARRRAPRPRDDRGARPGPPAPDPAPSTPRQPCCCRRGGCCCCRRCRCSFCCFCCCFAAAAAAAAASSAAPVLAPDARRGAAGRRRGQAQGQEEGTAGAPRPASAAAACAHTAVRAGPDPRYAAAQEMASLDSAPKRQEPNLMLEPGAAARVPRDALRPECRWGARAD